MRIKDYTAFQKPTQTHLQASGYNRPLRYLRVRAFHNSCKSVSCIIGFETVQCPLLAARDVFAGRGEASSCLHPLSFSLSPVKSMTGSIEVDVWLKGGGAVFVGA